MWNSTTIINRILFEGNKRIENKALQDEVKLKSRVVYTRSRVKNDVQRLIDVYQRNGRYAATVEPKIIQLPQNRIDLIFEIIEGPVTEIRRVSFIGNSKFFTSWIPITFYDYPALSYVNYSQKFHSLLSKLIIKFKLAKFLSKNIFVKRGDILIWNGNMIHQGNLNSSKNIAVAFQMKFTEKKFHHEDSIQIENLNLESKNDYENLDILSQKFKEVIEFSKKLNDNMIESIFEISHYIKENSLSKNLIISFALSVLAQRLSTTNFTIDGINEKKKLINNLDIFSIYLGGENLASLERLLKQGHKNEIIMNLKKNDQNKIFQKKKVILDYLNK